MAQHGKNMPQHFDSSFYIIFLYREKKNPSLIIITYSDSRCPPKKLSPFSSIICRSAHISPPPYVLFFHFFLPPIPVIRRIENQRRGNFQTNFSDTESICWCALHTLLLVWDPRALTSPICLIFANFLCETSGSDKRTRLPPENSH